MTNGLVEGLQKTLAQVRKREEMCNDVALSIQRLLDAEGVSYVEWDPVKELVKEPAIKTPTVKAVATKAKAATAKAPTLEKRTCETCGDEYQPKRKDNRFCSPDCGKAGHNTDRAAPEAPRLPAPVRPIEQGPEDRIAQIRAAARRMDGLPEED